jgi:hypothetical protein
MNKPSSADTCLALREFGRRIAVSGALAVALASLLGHAPVWLACLRGTAALVGLLFVARFGSAALARTLDSAPAPIQPKKGPPA